jgi:hypothetical protein
MKYLITVALLSISLVSSAQTINMSRGVNDDGKNLKLTYKANIDGKYIEYENTFDVKGWSKQQKDLHVKKIIDSLNSSPATPFKTPAYSDINMNDDGSRLILSVDYRSSGQNIKYTKSYDVKGKSQQEKDALVKKVLEGLGVK